MRVTPEIDEELISEATPTPGAVTELPGDSIWVLELLTGQPLIEDTFLTFKLYGDTVLGGSDGCNSFGQVLSDDDPPIVQTDGKFSAPRLLRTLIECSGPEGIHDQADRYMKALRQADGFRVEGDRLEILGPDGEATLVFVRQHPLPGHPVDLLGSAWRLLTEDDGDGRATTLAFASELLVAGSTACRDYLGTYFVLAGRIRFALSMLSSLGRSCSEESLVSERRFRTDMWPSGEYSVHEDGGTARLRIRSRGKVLVFEPLLSAVEEAANVEWSLRAFVPLHFLQRRPNGSEVWALREVTEALPGTKATISFDEDGIWGSAACNSYAAPASIGDGSIAIEVLSSTKNECEGANVLIEQRKRYLDLLPHLTGFGTASGYLFMHTDDGMHLLFKPK